MKKSMLKISTVILTILMMAIICSSISNVYALTPDQITGNQSVNGVNEITNLGQQIVGILQTVGIILSVVILIILGIKYMMGSAEEKAEYKKTMIPYVMGAIFIFAASTLANVVYNFVSGI